MIFPGAWPQHRKGYLRILVTTALVLMEALEFVCKQHLLFLNSLGLCFDLAVD